MDYLAWQRVATAMGRHVQILKKTALEPDDNSLHKNNDEFLDEDASYKNNNELLGGNNIFANLLQIRIVIYNSYFDRTI